MLLQLAVGIGGSAACVSVLYRTLAPFGRIWHGDASAANTLPTHEGRVQARNYLAYLLWIVPGTAGLLLIFSMLFWGTLTHLSGKPPLAAIIGIVVFGAAWPLALVHVFVNATGRPRFLVPPPFRHQPGEVTRDRRDASM